MAHSLMIYIDENTKFDPDKTISAISRMDNADIGLLKGEYSEGFGQYGFEGETTTINIGKDWEFIAAESIGKPGLHFAINLQQLLDIDLTLTDTDYSFLCKLNKVFSVKELENIMVQGIYMDE